MNLNTIWDENLEYIYLFHFTKARACRKTLNECFINVSASHEKKKNMSYTQDFRLITSSSYKTQSTFTVI